MTDVAPVFYRHEKSNGVWRRYSTGTRGLIPRFFVPVEYRHHWDTED